MYKKARGPFVQFDIDLVLLWDDVHCHIRHHVYYNNAYRDIGYFKVPPPTPSPIPWLKQWGRYLKSVLIQLDTHTTNNTDNFAS